MSTRTGRFIEFKSEIRGKHRGNGNRMENIKEKYFSSIWKEMTTLTKIPQPHVHTLVLSFYVQSSLQSSAQVFLKGNKTKVGTPVLKGFPGQELHQYCLHRYLWAPHKLGMKLTCNPLNLNIASLFMQKWSTVFPPPFFTMDLFSCIFIGHLWCTRQYARNCGYKFGYKNPKKNFKTTFHNSRDSRKAVRRHLFVVSVPMEVEQRIQKIQKKIVPVYLWKRS